MRSSTRRRLRRRRRQQRRAAAAPAVVAEPGRSRDNPVAGDIPVAPAAEQARARKRKPGTSSSISSGCGLDYVVGDSFGIFARTISAWSTRSSRCSAPRTPPRSAARRLREVLHRRRLAVAGAGHPVRADLLHHRRRAAREGAGAGAGRGSRWRCRDARRDGGAAEIFRRAAASRKPSSRRWSRCSRGSIRSRRRIMRRRANCR